MRSLYRESVLLSDMPETCEVLELKKNEMMKEAWG